MIKAMMERAIPPGFDPTDDVQVSRHCRIAVDAVARLGGRMHWLHSYVTEDKIFGVVVFEHEDDLVNYTRAAGTHGQDIKVHTIIRQLDPSLAE
jgi:hypothetical protein